MFAKKLIDNYEITKNYNNKIVQSRDAFSSNLKEKGFKINSGLSNFVLVDFNTKERKEFYNQKLLSEKIYIKDSLYSNPSIVNNANELSRFGLISIGPYEIMKKIEEFLVY